MHYMKNVGVITVMLNHRIHLQLNLVLEQVILVWVNIILNTQLRKKIHNRKINLVQARPQLTQNHLWTLNQIQIQNLNLNIQRSQVQNPQRVLTTQNHLH